MSAFMVDREHIDALVRAGLADVTHRLRWINPEVRAQVETANGHVNPEDWSSVWAELRHDTADSVGEMLISANLLSVTHRYPDTLEGGGVPGPCEEYWRDSYSYPMNGPDFSPVVILKAIACYEYQSCEHPEWERSEARAFCEALRDYTIVRLPGYDDAPWGIYPVEVGA